MPKDEQQPSQHPERSVALPPELAEWLQGQGDQTMDLTIRTPHAGDGDGLARGWLDAGAYYAKLNPDLFQIPEGDGLAPWLEEQVLSHSSDNSLTLVAEMDQQAVGYISATIQPPDAAAAFDMLRDWGLVRMVIGALIVQEAYRHQGVGTRLMQAAEEWGRSKGAVIALLDTYIDSPLSMPFYEVHMGYSRRALRFRKELM
jgi:GNAT superfamily N-acetyltransferase